MSPNDPCMMVARWPGALAYTSTGYFSIIVEALVHARGDDAGETCQALGPADGLDVPVKDLIGRRLVGRLRQNFIGLEDDRVAVLNRQVRDRPGGGLPRDGTKSS